MGGLGRSISYTGSFLLAFGQVVGTWQGILVWVFQGFSSPKWCWICICTIWASHSELLIIFIFILSWYFCHKRHTHTHKWHTAYPFLGWFTLIDPILLSEWAEVHVSIIFLEGSGTNTALAPVNVGWDQTSCSRGNPNLLFLVNWRLISLPHSNLLTCKHCVPLDCF